MKTLHKINLFAVCLPFIIAFFAIIDESAMVYAILSTMLTGFIQVCIAIIMLFKLGMTRNLILYFLITATFFLTWWLFPDFYFIWLLPPSLAVFLTVIVYDAKMDSHEP